MRSSTSSFRGDVKAIIVAVAVLLVGEAAFRCFGARLSGELREAQALPARAQALGADDGVRLLVIGNSLTIFGFDQPVFVDSWRQQISGDPVIGVETARGSGPCEWYYMFERYLQYSPSRPDLLILPLNTETVSDQASVRLGRLVTYCEASDVPRVLETDLTGFEQRASFLHAFAMQFYASRDKVREIAFQKLIPCYKEGEQTINASQRVSERSDPNRKLEFQSLGRLLQRARDEGVRAVCVAMPQGSVYPLPPELIEAIEGAGATLVDMRRVEMISAEQFSDGVHLTPEGAKRFSTALGTRLSDLWRGPSLSAVEPQKPRVE